MNKSDLLKLLGPLPENCPLEPVVLESVDCGKYVRETVEYAVEAGDRLRLF